MLDLRADSIIYQAQGYLVELVNTLITDKRLGKAFNKEWDKADLILSYLEAWEERLKLDDITQMNYVLECLISLAKLNEFPSAPDITGLTPPSILYGLPGPPGDSITGPQGPAGLATDFQSTLSITGVVDSFDISLANAARWDYFVKESAGEQRADTVIGDWKSDGTTALFDAGTTDLGGVTSGIEFDIVITGTTVQLIAVISSGTWLIKGSRYFIPNNGNGSGPVSSVLADGTILIGNSSNIAQSRSVTGDIAITNTGVTAINPGVIVNNDIDSAAAIGLSKLAALTPNKIVATDDSGVLTTTTIDPSTLNPAAYVLKAGDTMSGALSMGSHKITNTLPATATGEVVVFEQLPVSSEGVIDITTNTYQITAGVQGKKLNFSYPGKRFVSIVGANQLSAGLFIWLKDSALTAGTSNIVLTLPIGNHFEDGTDTLTISNNGNCVGIYTDGVSTFYILEQINPPSTSSVSAGKLTYKNTDIIYTGQLLLKSLLLKSYKDMALKTKTASVTSSDTFTAGVNGSRIYLITFSAAASGSSVSISDGTGSYTIITSGGTADTNMVATATMPAVLTEEGTGLKFYPIGAGTVVTLTAGSSAAVAVTYYDL